MFIGFMTPAGAILSRYQDTRYKIQETLFNVDFQEYNLITIAMSYFVDKHDMKNCTRPVLMR